MLGFWPSALVIYGKMRHILVDVIRSQSWVSTGDIKPIFEVNLFGPNCVTQSFVRLLNAAADARVVMDGTG